MKANNDWKKYLDDEIKKDYYQNLKIFLKNEIEKGKIIYPKKENWFNALSISPEKIRVIILGQDPYHGENQAHGFSFSVEKGIQLPPSLKNIYTEIEKEYSFTMSKKNGNLIPWVQQGVMLLNSILTVEKNKPGSHKNQGWEIFTDKIISILSENFEHKVFILWGNFAIKKEKLIDSNKHLILKSPHPSPFSAYNGFFGNNHFLLTNQYLKKYFQQEIDWIIKD
jgi:uracil-DNA glycosylase